MPVYNESLIELNQSISSIQRQTYRSFEFIIVDDNPRSNSIKRYLLRKQKEDNRIKILFHKKNLGTVKSANDAINISKGNFIARMDADDIAERNRLKLQLNFCKKYNLDVSCCNFYNFVDDISNKHLSYPNITQINQHKIKRVMSYLNIAMGPTLFFKRKILNKISGYRNILCEDYDLVSRAIVYDYKVGYLSIPLLYKRSRVNSLSGINALKEFVIIQVISKYIRYTNFTKIIPLSNIVKVLNKISYKDYDRYREFAYNSLMYRNTRHINYLINKYYYAFSSLLMCKRSIFSEFYSIIQKIFLWY